MNAGALVYCLLDAEGDYTPEGYELLDTAQVGDYELKLWRGRGHVSGEEVKFNEISLNAVGRSFDPDSQRQHFPGSTHALGHRSELLNTVARWINKYGDLYIGSYSQSKLAVYYNMFRRYLRQFDVSVPYAPFDECEGQPEYFHVKGSAAVVEAILQESVNDSEPEPVNVQHYIDKVPSAVAALTAEAKQKLVGMALSGDVNRENFNEVAENVVDHIVYSSNFLAGDELVDNDLFQSVLTNVLAYATKLWPST